MSVTDTSKLAQIRALVVEDEAYSRAILMRQLHKLGLSLVVGASNGAEAEQAIKASSEPFHVILSDLQMPDVDGIEFFRRLAALQNKAKLVLVSGIDERLLRMAEDVACAQGLVVLAALRKPVDIKALTEALHLVDQVPQNIKKPKQPVTALTEEELREAIRNQQLTVHYQPKVDPANRNLLAVEALVRWEHPDRGIVGPDAFIPLAEKSGAIEELTDLVLETAIQQAGHWHADGLRIGISVNFATSTLTHLGLPDKIVQLAKKYNLPPSFITLEVTESAMMEDQVTSFDVLARLRMKEIGLSIDDFGTGYSTMKQLSQVPFSELKIDKSFVSDARTDRNAMAIVQSSVQLAKVMNLRVVAEGVETEEDFELIRTLGCDEAQGYFIARSMPGDALPGWLRKWEIKPG